MLKKASIGPAAGLGCIALLSVLFERFAGGPRTPLSLLGSLSLIGIAALIVFFLVAAATYGPNGTSGGIGALAMLIVCIGAAVIASTLAAAAFGTSVALYYVGAAVIAVFTTAAIAAVPKD